MKTTKLIPFSLLCLLFAGCGGGDGSANTPSNTDTGNAVDTTGVTPTCEMDPKGVFTTSVADIIYQNKTVSGSASHLEGDGCLLSANLIFDIDGGCKLSLEFGQEGTNWALASATFDADANCGADFPEAAYGAYQANIATSKGSLINVPTVDTPDAENSCLTSDSLTMAGLLQFSGPTNITGWLTNLSLKGALSSAATATGSCPETPAFCNAAQECGQDDYGEICGECEEGFQCNTAHVCEVNHCPTKAPPAFGIEVGDTAEQITLRDCDGNDFKFEDKMCNNNATFINLFAPW